MSFSELGLAPPLLRAISSEGYTTPTPIQTAAIPHVLAGRDLMASAQTGTGKTAAFALPILQLLMAESTGPRGSRPIRVLVLSPTRELATQINESFATYGRHTGSRRVVIYGGVSQVPQVRSLRQGVEIVVATPGRLMDLVNQRHVDLRAVEILVLDEADRMLDMGFMPDLKRIIERLPAKRQTLLFSATIPTAIEQLARSILRDPVPIRIAPKQAATELVEQSVCFVSKPDKRHVLAGFLTTHPIARAIVFTRTKHGADRVAQHLNRAGVRAEAMHGDKSQSNRQKTLASFKSNRPPILVATDVAARGIDVDGVSHVFNFDLPHEPETYVHRIGRTGRAGAAGIAVSFCDREERGHLRAIERLLRKPITVDHNPPVAAGVTLSPEQADDQSTQSESSLNRPYPSRDRERSSNANRPGKFKGSQPASGSRKPYKAFGRNKRKPSGPPRRPASTR